MGKSIVQQTVSDNLADTLSYMLVPVVPAGKNEVAGMLGCEIDQDKNLRVKFFKTSDYSIYGLGNANEGSNANALVAWTMILHQNIWGNSIFRLNDERLFNSDVQVGPLRYKLVALNKKRNNTGGTSRIKNNGSTTNSTTITFGFSAWAVATFEPDVVNSWAYNSIAAFLAPYLSFLPDGSGSGTYMELTNGIWINSPGSTNTNTSNVVIPLKVAPDGIIIFDYPPNYWENKFSYSTTPDQGLSPDENFSPWTQVPLTTEKLRQKAFEMGWVDQSMPPVTVNRKVGKAFEEAAIKYFGLTENRIATTTPDRGINAGIPNKKTRPDGSDYCMFTWTEAGSGEKHIEPIKGIFDTEVKAISGPLTLAGNDYQILGELERLDKAMDAFIFDPAHATSDPPIIRAAFQTLPVLFLILTPGTVIDQSIINEAIARKINIWVSYSNIDNSTNQIGFTQPKMVVSFNPEYPAGSTVPLGLLEKGGPLMPSISPTYLAAPVNPNFDVDPEEIQ